MNVITNPAGGKKACVLLSKYAAYEFVKIVIPIVGNPGFAFCGAPNKWTIKLRYFPAIVGSPSGRRL